VTCHELTLGTAAYVCVRAHRSEGTYTILFLNPAGDSSRKVTLAWLVGEDTDRPLESAKPGASQRCMLIDEAPRCGSRPGC
jgi:hypothetical protein